MLDTKICIEIKYICNPQKTVKKAENRVTEPNACLRLADLIFVFFIPRHTLVAEYYGITTVRPGEQPRFRAYFWASLDIIMRYEVYSI